MFSRNGSRRSPAGRAGTWSITGRLTALYALSAFVLLLLATSFLYWTLARNFAAGDADFLAGKVQVLRTILRERPGDPGALEEEVRWESAAPQFARYYARVLDADGHILMETPGMGAALPVGSFPPALAAGDTPDAGPRRGSRADGRPYLLMSAWAASAPGGRRRLQLALDVTSEDALMADYRRMMALVLLVGVLVSAGAGRTIARRGLRPVTEIARMAERITPTRLDPRISGADWPDELAALARVFDAMLDRLEDSFRRLSQFSADLAHELRTPIGNLRGTAEVALSRARTPEEYQEVLESSLEEYGRVSRVIDSLLFLARAESGRSSIERSTLDLGAELEAVREFYHAVAEERGVRLTRDGTASANADPILFRRALGNLVSNALRHTPPGGAVRLVAESCAGGVEVRVSDTGCGIAPEHLPRIFDRFYRVDPSRSENPDGTGLGLPIVKSIVELHGGDVGVRSEPGAGTMVTLSFPSSVE